MIEARWQDLIARIADLGIETPQTLTPRQVHSHLTHTAVLDRDTSAALSRVVDAVEVARYAAPGGTVGDPAAGHYVACHFPLHETPVEVTLTFEGHVTQIHATGRVIGVQPTVGFGVKMLDLGEHQRSIIRTWVARAS